jgi:PPM family protein phosphatase
MVDDATIAKIIGLQADLAEKAGFLIEAANEHGGRDNISVVMVEVTDALEKKGFFARLRGK